MTLKGLSIRTSVWLTDSVEEFRVVRRTWRERWLTRPWTPTQAQKLITVTVQVPSRRIYQTPNGIICHPAMLRELERPLKG